METEKGYQKLDGESRRTAERLLRRLREAGHSSTRPRRAVVQVLACAKSCLSPAEILTRGQAFHPPLGLVTVYRTLDVLSDLRLVRKVHLPNGCHSYALAECPHGHHVICQRCHQVTEFEGCDLDLSAMLQRVRKQTGYEVREHRLELFGVCPRCQQAEAHETDFIRRPSSAGKKDGRSQDS